MDCNEKKYYCPLLDAIIDKTTCLEICLVVNEEIVAEAISLPQDIFLIPGYQDICDRCRTTPPYLDKQDYMKKRGVNRTCSG